MARESGRFLIEYLLGSRSVQAGVVSSVHDGEARASPGQPTR